MASSNQARNLKPVIPGAQPETTDAPKGDDQASNSAEAAAVDAGTAPEAEQPADDLPSADVSAEAETTITDVSEEAGETVAAAEPAAPESDEAAPAETVAEVEPPESQRPVLTKDGWLCPEPKPKA
jgi:hypothetical protein